MQFFEKLIPGKYFHLYNRGINGQSLFLESANYQHFLRLYEKYIDPIGETYAWCLMPNHFHFLIRIREFPNPDRVIRPCQGKDPSLAFSHLFNSYAQAFNKRYKRTGALFETPFKRKSVNDLSYFKELVFYIHNNPVKHGYCKDLLDYPWSSYMTIISFHKTKLQRDKVVGWFDSKTEFALYHQGKHDLISIESLIID
jgi:putative transposase